MVNKNSSNSLVFGRWPQTKTVKEIQIIIALTMLQGSYRAQQSFNFAHNYPRRFSTVTLEALKKAENGVVAVFDAALVMKMPQK